MEGRNQKVESLGWLTESTVLPKRHKAIEGVGPSSILELKAQFYKSQQESKQAKDLLPDVEYHRAKKKITHLDIFSQKNLGVDSRARRDKLQLKAEEDGSACYAALERKAELYAKLVKGELSDEEEKEKYCVDFFRKGMQDTAVCADNDVLEQLGKEEEKEVDPSDPFLTKISGPGRKSLSVNRDEHKRLVREVHEEANQARDKATSLKSRRQAQEAINRERLRQAFLRKQLEKLKPVKTDGEGG